MLATATCATAQNAKFPASGVSVDSVQTEKDSTKANKEIEANKKAETNPDEKNRRGYIRQDAGV